VLQRAVAEARANRNTVDVVETNAPKWNRCTAKTSCSRSSAAPRRSDRTGHAPSRRVGGTRLNVFAQAYNTKAVKKEELPKTWEDLLDPKWKANSASSKETRLARGLFAESARPGHELFKEIVAENGISVRKGIRC